MEVMIPSPAVDFNFDSACTTPFISAPSSPLPFGNYFSAPTSPTRRTSSSSSSYYFNEFADEIPNETPNFSDDDEDFAFDFSGQLETSSPLTADELFDGGKIKPLRPPLPPRPKSPKRMINLSRNRKKEIVESCNESAIDCELRGRDRSNSGNHTESMGRKKGGRSLSPFRVSDLLMEEGKDDYNDISSSAAAVTTSSSLFSTSSFAWFWYRKWKLKDLLLFRSASEGHTTSNEQLKKYAILKKSQQEDVKNSSFRSIDSASGSVSGRSRRRRGQISAHELHYTRKRAMAEEMRRKTSLPYKPGLFGCLGFRTGVPPMNEISRGFGGSMPRERYN